MQVKATKKMCSELNKYFKSAGIPYFAYHTKTTKLENYLMNADSTGTWRDGSYDRNGFMFWEYITVSYPSEYYCYPVVLTTKALNKIFKNCPSATYNDFMNGVCEYLEV